MTQTRREQLGRLGVVFGLCVACNGQVHSLGDEPSTGGRGNGANGGTGASIGNVAGDGTRSLFTATTDVGGTTGSSYYPGWVSNTLPGGSSQGGSTSWGMGGQAGSDWDFRATATKPYAQVPSLPIDPNCTCTDATKICNAARQCVDRCDRDGRCALWLTDHAVNDLFVDGTTVYYLQSPATDPLGNKGTNGSLYRIDDSAAGKVASAANPSATKTRIATDLGDPETILGRYQSATYVLTTLENGSTVPVRITDSGTVSVLDPCAPNGYCNEASLRGHWLAYSTGQKLFLIDLDGDLTPQVLVDVSASTSSNVGDLQVLRELVWYEQDGKGCHFELANLALGPTCELVYSVGGHVFLSGDEELYGNTPVMNSAVDAYNVRTQKHKTLFNQNAWNNSSALADGFIYIVANFQPVRLVRFPTSVGRLPQDVLPAEIADPAFKVNSDAPYDFFVNSDTIYWFQSVQDRNQGQYIFRAPLPPQPCDAELPCADSSQVCSNGLCVAA